MLLSLKEGRMILITEYSKSLAEKIMSTRRQASLRAQLSPVALVET